jgi:hypothetical protein
VIVESGPPVGEPSIGMPMHEDVGAGLADEGQEQRKSICARIAQRFKNIPGNCWASHNGVGCSSLGSTCTFMFGSCRQFFGEPCFNGPTPLPRVPGADYGPQGYGQQGYGQAGCGCR